MSLVELWFYVISSGRTSYEIVGNYIVSNKKRKYTVERVPDRIAP